jgi:hypothetical protein
MRIASSLGSLPVGRLQVLPLPLVALVVALAGCGEGGAASGATVSIYAAAPLCREAQRVTNRADDGAGDLEVRVICLPPVATKSAVHLVTAGANARRATEDSTSVAFLEAPGPGTKFSQSIVEAADVAWLETDSGSTAMDRILSALEGSPSPPRKAVLDEVG